MAIGYTSLSPTFFPHSTLLLPNPTRSIPLSHPPSYQKINAILILGESEPGGATRQAKKLREEGVTVHVDAMGELSIELDVVGWFPDDLPVDI